MNNGALFNVSNFGNSERAFEGDRNGRTFPNIIYQRGPEAADAGSALMPDARVNDTRGAFFKELTGQSLRRLVTILIQTIRKAYVPANIVKVAAKIGQEIYVRKSFSLWPVDLLKFLAPVVSHFPFRSFSLESRVPYTSLLAIETAS